MAITNTQRKIALGIAVGDPGNASAALGITPDAIMNALLGVLGTNFDAQCATILAYMANQANANKTTYTVV